MTSKRQFQQINPFDDYNINDNNDKDAEEVLGDIISSYNNNNNKW